METAAAAVFTNSLDPVSDQFVLDVVDFEVALVHRETKAQVEEGAPPPGSWLTYFFIHCDGVMNDGNCNRILLNPLYSPQTVMCSVISRVLCL